MSWADLFPVLEKMSQKIMKLLKSYLYNTSPLTNEFLKRKEGVDTVGIKMVVFTSSVYAFRSYILVIVL